jgi:D-sedoheptulose 7-phosphate isomerase
MQTEPASFVERFVDDTITILHQLSLADIEKVIDAVVATRGSGGRLFFCGSGGGAGHASHATCDFRKIGQIESYCVTDNASELTARINDEGWDTSYSNWLRQSRLGSDDTLFVFSVGGGDAERNVSTNLVRAMEHARSVGAKIVGIAGRDGGLLREMATACVVIPTVDPSLVTPQTEGLQALVWHLIVSDPRVAVSAAKWESMDVGATAAP